MIIEDFLDFIREQGVVGLAIGFILGGAVQDVVSALVNDIINPIIGLLIGQADTLKQATIFIGSAEIKWGDFVATLLDFVVIAVIIYYAVKKIKVNKLDKKSKA